MNQLKLMFFVCLYLVISADCLATNSKFKSGFFNQNANDRVVPIRKPIETHTVNWNNISNGPYTKEQEIKDFGAVNSWQSKGTEIIDGTCKISLLKNALSGEGGHLAKHAITPGTEYEVSFDVKFDVDFEWCEGGKVGFGFGVGNGFAGNHPAWDGTGGSYRLMWYKSPKDTSVYFHPYGYFKDQPTGTGFDFKKEYPKGGSIKKDQWYKINLYVKSNTGSNVDGWVRLEVDGYKVLDQPIRWTTDDSMRHFNTLWFETFRGGQGKSWMSEQDGYIYFDNVTWTLWAK